VQLSTLHCCADPLQYGVRSAFTYLLLCFWFNSCSRNSSSSKIPKWRGTLAQIAARADDLQETTVAANHQRRQLYGELDAVRTELQRAADEEADTKAHSKCISEAFKQLSSI
jgi:hypothetical protein